MQKKKRQLDIFDSTENAMRNQRIGKESGEKPLPSHCDAQHLWTTEKHSRYFHMICHITWMMKLIRNMDAHRILGIYLFIYFSFPFESFEWVRVVYAIDDVMVTTDYWLPMLNVNPDYCDCVGIDTTRQVPSTQFIVHLICVSWCPTCESNEKNAIFVSVFFFVCFEGFSVACGKSLSKI